MLDERADVCALERFDDGLLAVRKGTRDAPLDVVLERMEVGGSRRHNFGLHADIDLVGTAAMTTIRIELSPNTTFSLDEVHGEEGKELKLRVREGNEVRLDIATYALDEADAAQPALRRLEASLTALRPMIEAREERRLGR